ncbi:TRAP transporter substrate-binding protein [Halomonas sp. McH1-25]|uniref:TRAP transporter substrate-binding protein n=1 Tax=unclassified Halomonas TaxID=2609666 RepID=UPI001EF4DD9B|nr:MULTISPECIES: TRAP transporter substrate-binding protein [unclassified Halomonas]MCG7599369.1 TRAP transporter substrate-binding protein [Halomonas sp. McH1-25]MCP1344523.1 TRAP transporter substrate-binding protein [Halomonas sp. FL8]MCP1361150.1 TRAP transporter substrate-binding protein [Halomonas sp. BBD45]MCP1367526.1 TRAP transporter substrate-binding protein [Halomonas sp. BBD48]
MTARFARTALTTTIAGVALASTSLGALAAQTVTVGHTTSDNSHYSVGVDAFKKTLEELSGGEFAVEEHPSGALGGERAMIEGLQIGTIDTIITSTGPLGNFVPETYVLDLPFLFADYDQARCVLDGEIGQDLLDQIGQNNLVGLAWTENGFRHLTNSLRDVKTPEDAAGLKIRTMENQMHMAAFEEMDVHPTPMAFPELFTALQQGTVDGQENPVSVILTSNLWEVQDHMTLTGHVYSPAIMLASPVLWDGLSDEQKGWFTQAAKAGAEATRAEVSRLETEGVKELKDRGVTVVESVDKSQFQEAVEPSYSVYTDQYGSEMLDKIRNSECLASS